MRWWAVAMAIGVPGMAQATTNIEKQRSEDDGLTGSLQLDGAMEFGTVNLVRLEAETHAYWNDGTNHVLVLAESAFESERSSSDARDASGSILDREWRVYNSGLGHLRYGRDVSDWLRPEVFSGVSYDEFLYIEQRWIVGAGPRFTLAKGERGRANLGTSWMWEYERSNPDVVLEDPDRQRHRLSAYVSASLRLSDSVETGATMYAQPALSDPADYRLLIDVMTTVAVGDSWETGVEVEARYDSEPPAVAEDHPTLTAWNGAVSLVLVYEF